MRSLSMRIANPHLLTKKSRFISYPTKKAKDKTSKLKHNQYLNSDNELSKALMSNTVQIDPITMDPKSYAAIENDNPSMVSPQLDDVSMVHLNKGASGAKSKK